MNDIQTAKPPQYLNDFWTPSIKDLGYEHLGETLCDLAVNCDPPFAVAVQGGWGSGKTSLLRTTMHLLGGEPLKLDPDKDLIQAGEVPDKILEHLKGQTPRLSKAKQKEIKTIWFNPWQHQQEAHPMVALLQEIRDQFSIRLKMVNSGKKKFRLALKNGLGLMDALISSAIGITGSAHGKFGLDKHEEDAAKYDKENYNKPLDSQRFQMQFETAVSYLISDTQTHSKKGRLIIFVDDLDRCERQQVLDLLEAIKLYLNTHKCVFIFGLDPVHTERALTEAGLSEGSARQYLHKLFQMSFSLPRSRKFPTFISDNLKQLNKDKTFDFGAEPPTRWEVIEKKEKETEAGQDKPKDNTGKPADQQKKQFTSQIPLEEERKSFDRNTGEALTTLLNEILEGNPRRMKNFLNLLFFRGRSLKSRDKQQVDPLALSMLLGLRYYYPRVYRYLEENKQKAMGEIKIAMKNERQVAADDGLERWLVACMHLPQYEEPNPKADPTKDAYEKLDGDHHTDQNALFAVLQRFKNLFQAFTIDQETLARYLEP